ncbi:AhpD family alkylhydroperoxidase [Saccharopolyspora lacisalsi]|uniref:AhpD family alkylhydroperoxidase n=1 Tax=Halosaccharopolyspora lacisalsi TaxID=1000566 RepID=A0A839E090_9PSEU|nr:carboxymuconolactone decarboxylase family protein [Halosaccharopolyspora lacisalsi]MBA8826510.1 AhpD family alkylhydroperoxidase [Halosaccharopolyspora lacisalsi]
MEPRFTMSEQAPQLYRAMAALQGQVRQSVDPVLNELVKIRASQLNGCAFCIDMHTKDARAAGESEQRIYALNGWRETPFFTDRERAALALTEAVTHLGDGHVPDSVYEEAARHFDRTDLVALVWAIVAINAWNRIAITSRTVPGSYKPEEAR